MAYHDGFFRLGGIARAPVSVGGSTLAAFDARRGAIELPPQDFAPLDSTPFFLSTEQAIAGPNVSASPAALTLAMTNDRIGWVKSIELLLDGISPTSSVFWMLLIDGVPVQGLNFLTILGRNGAASVSKTIEPVTVMIPPGTTLSVRLTVNDAGAYIVGASLRGWFYPIQRAALVAA